MEGAMIPPTDFTMEFDDASSELSTFERTPSPFSRSSSRPIDSDTDSTPLSSYNSNVDSPSPDSVTISATASSHGGDEEQPPTKRRKLSPEMPQETVRLNLNHELQTPPAEQTSAEKEQKKHIERLLSALRRKKKIVVVAGAGISVSAGIPDFRSTTGLFQTLRKTQKLKSSGKFLFDAAVYRDAPSTASFHDMVRTLVTSTRAARPTPFHHLLARLAQEGRLLRLYTQNVDGIDTALPPLATQIPLPLKGPWPKTVQVHGGLDKMVCTKCNKLSDLDPEIFRGPIPPDCKQCVELDDVRNVAGKRSHGIGRLRPRMVLYHEHNPDADAIGAVTKADLRTRPDAVIVIGTSLKVPGVRRIVREMCATVRNRRGGITAWVNSDSEPPSSKEFAECFDYIVKAPSDTLANMVGLGPWTDVGPGGVLQGNEVTPEEVEEVKNKSTPAVVILSPRKPTATRPTAAPLPPPAPPPLQLAQRTVLTKTQTKLTFKLTKNVIVRSGETDGKKQTLDLELEQDSFVKPELESL